MFVELGSSWKTIGDHLNNKTDHFIKNHFYSHVKIFLRKVNKITGGLKEQKEINKLKSAVLTSLFKIAEEIEFWGFKDFFEFFMDIEKTSDIREKNFNSQLRVSVITLLDKLINANSLYIGSKPVERKIKRIKKSCPKNPETVVNNILTKESLKTMNKELFSSPIKIVKSNKDISLKFLETHQNSEQLSKNNKSKEEQFKLKENGDFELRKENFKNGLFVDKLVNGGKDDFGGEKLFRENYKEVNDEYLMEVIGDFSLNK